MGALFVAVVVIALALAFYFHQQAGYTLKRLESTGFTVDESFDSAPRLVIDRQAKKIAVIYAKKYEVFGFSDIESVGYKVSPGDSDRNRKRIAIRLKDSSKSTLVIKGRREELTDQWLAVLKAAAQ